MTIELSDSQVKKYEDWKKYFDKLPYIGATGGHFGLNIIFTSIGQVIYGTYMQGEPEEQKIDLTEDKKW